MSIGSFSLKDGNNVAYDLHQDFSSQRRQLGSQFSILKINNRSKILQEQHDKIYHSDMQNLTTENNVGERTTMTDAASDSRNDAAVQATNDDASASYFARWAAFRKLLYQFLDVEKKTDGDAPIKKQILSLGAGFDTTYFQLQVPEKGEVVSAHYKLVPADLRDIQQLNNIISVAGMDPRYVWAVSSVSASLSILPDDAFGQQMIRNLEVPALPLVYSCIPA
ncbi:hypothetical protein JHK82_036692 [Glycine max]|nr:hypothetical protein JHK82_036692 [Glycine max]